MATWDAKEREQFKIDAENLKNDIDAIQSEKIKLVQDEIGKVEAEFLNFKSDYGSDQRKQRSYVDFVEYFLNQKIIMTQKLLQQTQTKAKKYLVFNCISLILILVYLTLKSSV